MGGCKAGSSRDSKAGRFWGFTLGAGRCRGRRVRDISFSCFSSPSATEHKVTGDWRLEVRG